MSSVRLIDTWRTTTFRLVLFYGAMFCAGITILLALIYFHTTAYIDQQIDQLLKAELQSCLVTPNNDLPGLLASNIQRDARHIEIFGLFSPDGRVLAGNASRMPPQLIADGTPHSVPVGSGDSRGDRVRSIRALATKLPNGDSLLVGREERQTEEIRSVIFKALEDTILIIALGTLGGVWLSVVRVRRIQEIQKISQDIVNGDISIRLPIAGSNDELDMLSKIVNGMLDEIEQRMRDIKGASDSIAHNLRTPLTRLRAMLNRFLQSSEVTSAYPIIEQAVEETDGLLSRFRALLRISEISGSTRREAFDQVDLNVILQSIQDIYAPLAEEKKIALTFTVADAVAEVWGDRALLFEAIMNLVDNAIKFTPPEGHVDIRVTSDVSGPCLAISDDGPGIPSEDINLVMQPFYRSNLSQSVPGYGVGLSVVGAIVHLHNFHFELTSSPSGTSVYLRCSPQ